MVLVIEFILVFSRRPSVSHDSHVLYHGMSSVESHFWNSLVTIFPTYFKKGFISSSPRTRGVDLVWGVNFVFRRDFAASCGVSCVRRSVMRRSCDGGVGVFLGVLLGEVAILVSCPIYWEILVENRLFTVLFSERSRPLYSRVLRYSLSYRSRWGWYVSLYWWSPQRFY